MGTACNMPGETAERAKVVEGLWWQGHSDKAMAGRLGVSQPTASRWRRDIGLPCNGFPGRPCKYYKIILAVTGEVMAHGTLKDCMEQMGKTEAAVRSIVGDYRRGRYKKWTVEVT